jgi:hypothetical protein
MARKKTTKKRVVSSRRRASYRTRNKKKSSSGGLNLGSLATPLSAVAYGFIRERASDMVSNTAIAKKLPATEFTDEGLMLGLLFVGKKLGLAKNKLVGGVMRQAQAYEWARIGETLADMQQNKKSSSVTVQNTAVMSPTIF